MLQIASQVPRGTLLSESNAKMWKMRKQFSDMKDIEQHNKIGDKKKRTVTIALLNLSYESCKYKI